MRDLEEVLAGPLKVGATHDVQFALGPGHEGAPDAKCILSELRMGT